MSLQVDQHSRMGIAAWLSMITGQLRYRLVPACGNLPAAEGRRSCWGLGYLHSQQLEVHTACGRRCRESPWGRPSCRIPRSRLMAWPQQSSALLGSHGLVGIRRTATSAWLAGAAAVISCACCGRARAATVIRAMHSCCMVSNDEFSAPQSVPLSARRGTEPPHRTSHGCSSEPTPLQDS